MDFICKGCGRHEFIPSEVRSKRDVVDDLELLLDTFQREPWVKTWLEHHAPELMDRFYDGIKKLLNQT